MANYTWETETSELVTAFPEQIKGKTFVITGCTERSIGALTAAALASASPKTLILLGRTAAKVQPVIDQIASIDASITVKFIAIDLANLVSVRTAATEVGNSVDHIDYLINSAGIMATPTYQTSADGYELQFAVCHLGHFLFTNLLIPKLAKGSRVISVSSSSHFAGGIRLDDYNFKNGVEYDPWLAYGQAKTGNVLFARSLAKRGITAFSCHPASTMTNLGSHFAADTDWAVIIGKLTEMGVPQTPYNTTEQAGATILRAALDPTLAEFSGAYLCHSQIAPAAAHASDLETAEKLWELSEKLVGQKFSF